MLPVRSKPLLLRFHVLQCNIVRVRLITCADEVSSGRAYNLSFAKFIQDCSQEPEVSKSMSAGASHLAAAPDRMPLQFAIFRFRKRSLDHVDPGPSSSTLYRVSAVDTNPCCFVSSRLAKLTFRASWTLGFSTAHHIAHANVMEATMEAHHQSASKYAFRPVIM